MYEMNFVDDGGTVMTFCPSRFNTSSPASPSKLMDTENGLVGQAV